MEYFGIDASSKTIHIVFLNSLGKPVGFFSCKSNKKTQDERFFELSNMFNNLVFSSEIFGAVEKPLFIQSAPATIGLSQVVGAIKLSLFNRNIPFVTVGVTTWKKDVIGKGNAKKEQVKQFIIDKFGLSEDLEQDWFDSCAIARFSFQEYKKMQEEKEENGSE